MESVYGFSAWNQGILSADAAGVIGHSSQLVGAALGTNDKARHHQAIGGWMMEKPHTREADGRRARTSGITANSTSMAR